MTDTDNILEHLEQIRQDALTSLDAAQDEDALQAWRTTHLGRSAPVMQSFSLIPKAPPELRPKIGQLANQVKGALESALEERQEQVHQTSLSRTLQQDHLDITLAGRRPTQGRLHPETQILRQIYAIFADMGFQIFRSREVESDAYNFELLNIPAHHPARDMWDTFHVSSEGMAEEGDNLVLRTHTSPGQIHAMRHFAPEPVRVILPGMCFRYEQVSARSEIQFSQVELLAVGEDITFGDLKGTLVDFAQRMYSENVRTRFRPSYFPFTEPSAEMDVECFVCMGKGCQVCKGAGWLEILGCGMVHPTVLKNGGYDPEKFTGFAAGMGPARIGQLKYKISDIRYYLQNDIRFLEQF